MTKKQLHDRIIKLNGWNPNDLKKHEIKILNERTQDLANLSDYGIKLEELRINIERRYEMMLSDVEQRLKTIKDHFNKILEEALAEIQNTLVFHKTQNMANLKDLEKDLNSLKQKEKKKPPKGIVFDMYTDDSLDNLFEFMNGFKEEFFGMILSKCILKSADEMKEVIIRFKV